MISFFFKFSIVSYGENGGWNEPDHLEFVSVLNQYAIDMPQRNMLVFDRLQRQFPERSTNELVSIIKEMSISFPKSFYSVSKKILQSNKLSSLEDKKLF